MKNKTYNNDWLKPRGYVHFTSKYRKNDIDTIKFLHSYVTNPETVAKHSYYPLIHNSLISRRYKIITDEKGNKLRSHFYFDKQGEKKSTAKVREIFYSTHIDAIIYSYYTQKVLSPLFEKILEEFPGLSDCISAYRKIPIEGTTKNKNNIHFARDVFNFIKDRKECIVLTFDVSSFFDSLNHKYLKKQWCKLLNDITLPADHYNIFKSVTDFSYVEFNKVLKEFGFKNSQQLRRKEIQTFCDSPEEFRKRVRQKGYIKPHPFKNDNHKIGIPQGTPISAFLSNLYLLEFDIDLYNKLSKINGLYRRYSDDIVIVCNKEDGEYIEKYVLSTIKEKVFLNINPDKVDRVNFYLEDNLLKSDSLLNYLGFEFNGQSIRIKSTSLSKFYRNLKRGVRSQARIALHSKNAKKRRRTIGNHSMIYKRKLFKKYSHLGGKSRTRNFNIYAKEASFIMNDPSIRKQLSNSWRILNKEIKKYEKKYKLKVLKNNSKK